MSVPNFMKIQEGWDFFVDMAPTQNYRLWISRISATGHEIRYSSISGLPGFIAPEVYVWRQTAGSFNLTRYHFYRN